MAEPTPPFVSTETPVSPIAIPPPAVPTPVVDPVHTFAAASAAEAAPALVPGAGVPLVSDKPSSVHVGVQASRVNTYFGVGAVVLLVITVIVVVLLAILVISIVHAR